MTVLIIAAGVTIGLLVGVVAWLFAVATARGERPKGQWVEVVIEPTEPGAQDVVGFVSVDTSACAVKTVYCANCAPALHRWRSWPIRRWSRGACSRCIECAMVLGEIALAKPSRGNGDKAGGLSVARDG